MVNTSPQTAQLPRLLCSLGMTPWDCPTSESVTSCYAVLLDGRVVGYVEEQLADDLVKRLRIMKVNGLEQVSKCTALQMQQTWKEVVSWDIEEHLREKCRRLDVNCRGFLST